MRAAVLGAGPAGFYAAHALLKRFPTFQVDLLERLPTPFGLIRYGVTPDHPATKKVTQTLSALYHSHPSLTYYGNVHISVPDLLPLYNLTLNATGGTPRTIPHPSTRVYSAHDFAGFINAHPATYASPNPCAHHIAHDITSTSGVGILGAGNVALDVARILLRPATHLRNTDIAPTALSALEASSIRTVTLFARRSPMHASWTVASLREILEKIPGIVTTVDQALVRRDLVNLRLTRPQRTALQLLSRRCFDHADHISSLSSSQSRVFHLQFLHSLRDFQLLPDAVRMRLNVPTSNSDAPSCVPSEFGAVFLSLGYEPSKGSGYRVGWANATASGVIGNNKWDAETVVAAIREQDILKDKRPGIAEWLKSSSCQRVTWEGWCRIDEEEKRRAALAGRQAQRIKIQSVSEMLRIASGQQALSSESPKSILNPQQMAPPSTIQH